MPTLDESFSAIVAALADRYGVPSHPAEDLDGFEAVIATLLAQSQNDRRAAPALAALRESGLLEPSTLTGIDARELADILKESGLTTPARVVAPLRHLARWAAERPGLDFDHMATSQLREELAVLKGIGPATADALVVHAFGRPTFPVSRAAYRVLVRHGWLDADAGYDEAASLLVRQRRDEPAVLARLANWLEQVGRQYCRLSAPRCDDCPLRPFLPSDGPIEPEG